MLLIPLLLRLQPLHHQRKEAFRTEGSNLLVDLLLLRPHLPNLSLELRGAAGWVEDVVWDDEGPFWSLERRLVRR
jgi:hypothetical protein